LSKVSIRGLDVTLQGNAIIGGLDLEVQSGEFLVLLGPSGCGKSTLLHSIAGLIDVADGSIEIGERDVTWADPKDRGIGMVFQSYALYPTMTVERNLSFGARIAGTPKDEVERRVERAAQILHLQELLRRKPSQLSGGQRQRVAIGRALVRDARVFLFDEPLSNLDAKLRGELRRELKQLHQALGTTMVYVTHDQVEAMTLASRIAVMKAGQIQQIGTPAEVYGRPANMFVAGFLGAPSMNFVDGRIEQEGGRWRFVAPAMQVDLRGYAFAGAPGQGQDAVLGVRPEHIRLVTARHGNAAAEGDRHGDAAIALVEPMGANQVVWLDTHGVTLAVDADAQYQPQSDQRTAFAIDETRISLFDRPTQMRL
jgi:multiple sugar transport system ATP-binding protein